MIQDTVVNQNGFNLGFTDNNFSVLNTTNQPYLSSGGPSTFDRFTGVANVVGARSMLSGLVNTGGIDYLTFRNYFDDGVNQTTSFLHALDSGLNFGHESVGGTTVVSQFIVDTSGVNFLSTQAGSSGGVNIQPGGSIQFSGVNGGSSGQFTIDTTSPSSEWRINAGVNQAGITVDQSTIRMQTQGSNRFFIDSVGDIRMHQYPNTRDDGGAPVNVLSTDVTGYVQSRPIASLLGGAWQLLGNAGTNAVVNFLGTTDAQDLAFRTNNLEQLRITQTGRFLAPNATDNIFIDGGNETMTGTSNIGIGDGAVGQNTTGTSNIALGQNALLFNTTGFSNMAIGQATLLFNNGNTNTAIGQGAGIVSTGNSNTYIGYGAGNTQSSGDNNIIIGQLANAGNNTGSNQLSIGNWIYGDNGNIGIGQPLPTERLDVLGNLRLDGAFMPGNNAGGSNQVLLSQGAGVAPIWVATSSLGLVGALVTADNGLTVNPANNVQLGGRLLQNTSIEINDGFGGFFFEVGPNAGEPLFKVDNGTQTASLGDDNGWSTGTVIEADVQNNQLRFSTNLLERMRIDMSGNIGIGTTTPSGIFVVATSTVSSQPSIFVDSLTGNVGVKNQSPLAAFQVNAGNVDGLRVVSTNSGYLEVGSAGAAWRWAHNYSAAGRFELLYNLGTLLSFNTSGNMAIGTAPVSNRLSVNGNTAIGGTGYSDTAAPTNGLIVQGNTGIGTNTPLFLFHVGSNAVLSGTTVARFENAGGTCDVTPNVAGGITCTSDQNLKKDIESIDPIDTLTRLLTVEVKSYRMNADEVTSTKQVGFLAQQLETQFPGLVLTNEEGKKSVSYAGMTPVLTQAVQTIYKFFTDIGVVIENGVAKVNEFVANRVRTKELCVGEEGNETCITKGQLDALLSGQGVAAAPASGITDDSQGGSQGQTGTSTDPVASSTDPVLDPAPVEPTPEDLTTDPVVDPTPVDPTPTETTSTEPAPVEESPAVDSAPVDPTPTE